MTIEQLLRHYENRISNYRKEIKRLDAERSIIIEKINKIESMSIVQLKEEVDRMNSTSRG